MKHIVVVGDGMADLPQSGLKGETPLESAYMPHSNFLAARGRTGLVKTCYPGLPVESAVANMGILGYDPYRFYPTGRASFEALARGIPLEKGDIALRCNLISLDSQGAILDFTSRQIPDGEALSLISHLSTGSTGIEIYSGQSYRNLLILRDAGIRAADLVTHPPHLNIGKEWRPLLVSGKDTASQVVAERINGFLLSSLEQIAKLNKSFHTAADMCWVWSPSEKPVLPPFTEIHGLTGSLVCGIDSIRGIGIAAQMVSEIVPEATGYSDTNLASKLAYTVKGLKRSDFVFVHINAPDEESHQHSLTGKLSVLERIDREFLGPLVEHLRQEYPSRFRIAFLPDHYTLLENGKHRPMAVPFLVYGEGIIPDKSRGYNEREARQRGSFRLTSLELLKTLF